MPATALWCHQLRGRAGGRERESGREREGRGKGWRSEIQTQPEGRESVRVRQGMWKTERATLSAVRGIVFPESRNPPARCLPSPCSGVEGLMGKHCFFTGSSGRGRLSGRTDGRVCKDYGFIAWCWDTLTLWHGCVCVHACCILERSLVSDESFSMHFIVSPLLYCVCVRCSAWLCLWRRVSVLDNLSGEDGK